MHENGFIVPVFLVTQGGNSRSCSVDGASYLREESVVIHPRRRHNYESPRFLAGPQGKLGIFSPEQQLLGPLHGGWVPLPQISPGSV